MKNTKKLLGFILTLAVVAGLVFETPITAHASYKYTVKVSLGSNEEVSFNEKAIKDLGGTVDGKIAIFEEKYNYKDNFELNLEEVIYPYCDKESTVETTYYLKGLKKSGTERIAAGGKNAVEPITGDETLVVAYGVGATCAYTIQYVDENGNKLIKDDFGYAAEGDVVTVPARRIPKYRSPKNFWSHKGTIVQGVETYDENGVLVSVEGGTVVTVEYNKNADNISYDESVDYQYQETTTTSSNTDGGTTVIDRRGQNGGNQPVAGNGGGNAGGGAAEEAAPAPEPETVTEPETPTDVIGIADEETAKAGESAKDRLVRNMIVAIIIAIIAVLAILIALIVADRKRKAQIANTNRKDNNE